MKKTAFIILPVVIVIGIFLFFNFKNKTENGFQTQELVRCTITETVEASGTIKPVKTVSIGSQISGLITDIYVDYNSKVKKGQLLAQIDTLTLKAKLGEAEANINNANANLKKLEAVTKNDKLTYDRLKKLYKRNFVSKSELDNAQYTYESDIAQLASAKAQIAQVKSAYITAKTNLSYARIISPVDGVVVSRNVDVGQTVAASFQTPELFQVAQDLTKMQIETNVSEADIGKVKEGQEVDYTLDGYPDEVFKGKVTQVRISPTTVSNVVTYVVVVQVNNEDLKLKPGMSANVSIITSKSEDVLCVPNIALKFTLPDSEEKYQTQGIWIIREGEPQRIDIKTGASDDSKTEIISEEITKGDQIILGAKGKTSQKQQKSPHPPRIF